MKIKNIVFASLLLTTPSIALAEEVMVGINGLVCAFCAQGIKRAFGQKEAVESVEVDMDNKMVSLKLRDPFTLSDEEIRKVITDTGFDVTAINRSK
jgi:copper chaperone CopZ